MPGLIVFRRRWSAGSDDLVVPGSILFTVHLLWTIILITSILLIKYDTSVYSVELLWFYKLAYIGILFVSICIELGICIVSMRGSILDTVPRAKMHYWLYGKLIILIVEVVWISLGITWLVKFYINCPIKTAKEIMLGLIICNSMVIVFILVTIWCTFDAAGRSWVKMKKYQRSMRESESRFNYKRSGSMNRNWRQRKVIRAYQDSWDHRCRLLFCCMGSSERNRNSFTDIAKLLSDFFRELDVVPSDVVAGLVLLRKFQKIERQSIIKQRKNGTYEFLSGVPVTARTQFLRLNDPNDFEHFQDVIHYMHYALGAYGWPMFLMTHSNSGACQLLSDFRCCTSGKPFSSCCCCGEREELPEIVDDNCCYCNYSALKRMIAIGDVEVIYTTFHVDIGETPFFIAIDYTKRKIVVSIRGTLSMKDVLTDLNAEGDVLPLDPPRDDWLGHKGMVLAAVYIKNKLQQENLIQRALTHDLNRQTEQFDLVLVGHSLGAGTAAILAILLKPEYPTLQCFSYSPPGGLLSMPAVEYTKTFITSIVVGKDVVPRIGLHQMEALRADLINAIKRSVDPKWKTIACTMICCCCGGEPTSVVEMESHESHVNVYEQQRTSARKTSAHPNDSSIALTLHNPLYPPGKILHIVRHHSPTDENKFDQGWRQVLKHREPVYQAIWVDNTDFDEVLISPAMIQDHMPDTVLSALNKVVTNFAPQKRQRQNIKTNAPVTVSTTTTTTTTNNITSTINPTNFTTTTNTIIDNNQNLPQNQSRNNQQYYATGGICGYSSTTSTNGGTPTSNKIFLETSFTNLQNPYEQQQFISHTSATNSRNGAGRSSSKASSSYLDRSQRSSLQYLQQHQQQYHQHERSSLIDCLLSDTALLSSNAGDLTSNSSCSGVTVTDKRNKMVAFDICESPIRTVMSASPTQSPYHPRKKQSSTKRLFGNHHHSNGISMQNKLKSIFSMDNNNQLNNYMITAVTDDSQNVNSNHSNNSHNNNNNNNNNDDWCDGVAPLASPETLSEISSISSRTSLILRDEKYFPINNGTTNATKIDDCRILDYSVINNKIMSTSSSSITTAGVILSPTNMATSSTDFGEINEDQLHTPPIMFMRRTPKITGNLSTCADDWVSVDQYKRMGRIFKTSDEMMITSSSPVYSSSEASTASGIVRSTHRNDGFGGTEIDNCEKDNNIHNNNNNNNSNNNNRQRVIDACLLCCPNCPCHSNQLTNHIPCQNIFEHNKKLSVRFRSNTNSDGGIEAFTHIISTPTRGGRSSGGIIHHRQQLISSSSYSSSSNSVNTNPIKQKEDGGSGGGSGGGGGGGGGSGSGSGNVGESIYIMRPGVLESHFPVYLTSPKRTGSEQGGVDDDYDDDDDDDDEIDNNIIESSSPISSQQCSSISTVTTINNTSTNASKLSPNIFYTNITTANKEDESLPLLTNLSERKSKFGTRNKKLVYPIERSPLPLPLSFSSASSSIPSSSTRSSASVSASASSSSSSSSSSTTMAAAAAAVVGGKSRSSS